MNNLFFFFFACHFDKTFFSSGNLPLLFLANFFNGRALIDRLAHFSLR